MKIKLGVRQTFLARKLGISQGTVSAWVNMKSQPVGLQRAALLQNFPKILEKIDAAWKTQD